MDFKDKKALVCGMAKSGVSAACLLNSLGADVTLQDYKRREELNGTEDIEKDGIKLFLGANPDSLVTEQDLIVLSPGIASDLPFVLAALDAGTPVWSEVELAYRLTPCPVCAITGTNGKTTTTALAGEIFKTEFPKTAVVGNIGVAYSGEVSSLTEKDWVVAEISSFQMENAHEFRPRISAVLNITPDHLNRHKTMENYVAAKEMVFKNQTDGDITILNREDEYCRKMADKTRARVFWFSSERELDEGIYIDGENIIVKWEGLNEILVNVNELKILGVHNYENAMAAAAAGIAAGISIENIRLTLKGFSGVEHRIEFVCEKDGVEYYNDSKGTNPDASIKAVLAMKRPIVLIGGGYDKNSDFDEWTSTFAGRVKALVLLGETAQQIKLSAEKNGYNNIVIVNSFDNAVKTAIGLAEQGDCVLLSPACASWDMFKSYEERGCAFKAAVTK